MKSKTFLTVLLAVLLIAAAVVAQEPAEKPTAPFFTSLGEAKAAASADNRMIAIEFFATW
jgi:hypothetical protein